VRQKGKITRWNDNKGFGFLTPIGGGKEIFVHINAFKSHSNRPEINQIVSYDISTDNQGRVCAENASRLGDKPRNKVETRNPFSFLKKIGLITVIGFGAFSYLENNTLSYTNKNTPITTSVVVDSGSSNTRQIETAYQNRQSNLQVTGKGKVIRILADDNNGSRHQKFIIQLASGQTLLISHNIDLAPRISGLSKNDDIEFNGEYEWNAKGGVVHWTHHDPRGRHEDGWLKHRGSLYK